MKSSLIGLLTFAIGVSGSSMASIWAPLQYVEPPATFEQQPLDVPEQNVLSSAGEEFFDSFDRDDYFDGWFIPYEFRGMDEVWTILLTRDIGNEPGIHEWTALVLTTNPDGSSNDVDSFESVVRRHGKHLRFRTNSIRGITYEFDGTFIRTGHVFSNEEKVLRGTMRKVVKDRLKAEFTADFAYAEPHCFH